MSWAKTYEFSNCIHTSHNKLWATWTLRWKMQRNPLAIQKKTNLFQLFNIKFLYTPLYIHATTRPQSRMLSLCLGGMVIQSQIPAKFIPTRPDSNMKGVNIKKGVSHAPCSFQASALLSQQTRFKKSNHFGINKKIHLWHFLLATKQAVNKRLMHVQSAMPWPRL